mmetsp:Transcript_4987/g.15223  ORF Transcript_4987/g.15223 Transcript_4987/m.15223 type:complete len:205 (-) Transcript_4987:1270-1884(-)
MTTSTTALRCMYFRYACSGVVRYHAEHCENVHRRSERGHTTADECSSHSSPGQHRDRCPCSASTGQRFVRVDGSHADYNHTESPKRALVRDRPFHCRQLEVGLAHLQVDALPLLVSELFADQNTHRLVVERLLNFRFSYTPGGSSSRSARATSHRRFVLLAFVVPAYTMLQPDNSSRHEEHPELRSDWRDWHRPSGRQTPQTES